MADRERLRATFDTAATKYAQARPGYPDELFDALANAAGLRVGAQILEIGCGTGQATRCLVTRGFKITCVELGRRLASVARRQMAGTGVIVEVSAFEAWTPPPRRYDLVVAATSWKWLDSGVKYAKAWQVLRPGGHLAFWDATHVFPEGGDPFFAQLQPVYDEIGEGLPEGVDYPRPGELADDRDEIEATGLFDVIAVQHFDWEIAYNADQYIALLESFSGHIAMQAWQRERLFREIRSRLAKRPDGQLRRNWGAVLHVARRRSDRAL